MYVYSISYVVCMWVCECVYVSVCVCVCGGGVIECVGVFTFVITHLTCFKVALSKKVCNPYQNLWMYYGRPTHRQKAGPVYTRTIILVWL